MTVVELYQIQKEIKGKELFQIDRLLVSAGDCIGIVGANGMGKSTLLHLIAGLDQDFRGQIQVKGSLHYVQQLKEDSHMSGGEQNLQALQLALSSPGPIVILDEPTANLDEANRSWLVDQIRASSKTFLLVSHDRYFLDQLVTKIWAFEDGQVVESLGHYTDYQEALAKKRQKAQDLYDHYQKTRRQLEEEAQQRLERAQRFKDRKRNVSVSDYKVNSRMGKYDSQQKSLAKSGKALLKRLEQMDEISKPKVAPHYHFKMVGRLVNQQATLLNLDANEVRVGDRLLFGFSHFKLRQGEKVAITGPNQAGKTTFLRQVIGHHYAGYYKDDLQLGYFAQNFDQLDREKTVLETALANCLQDESMVRNLLAALGFPFARVGQKVATLSGGERVRLQLATLLLGDYDCLILDEPTNYLDISTLESVQHFLQDYPGTLMLVSHDRFFVKAVCQREDKIQEGQLITAPYQEAYANSKEKQRTLLQFQLDQLLMAPEADLGDIRQLQDKIEQVQQMEE